MTKEEMRENRRIRISLAANEVLEKCNIIAKRKDITVTEIMCHLSKYFADESSKQFCECIMLNIEGYEGENK